MLSENTNSTFVCVFFGITELDPLNSFHYSDAHSLYGSAVNLEEAVLKGLEVVSMDKHTSPRYTRSVGAESGVEAYFMAYMLVRT